MYAYDRMNIDELNDAKEYIEVAIFDIVSDEVHIASDIKLICIKALLYQIQQINKEIYK